MPERKKRAVKTAAQFSVREEPYDEREPEIRGIRTAVFTEEQGIDHQLDFDGNDPHCVHVIARNATGSAVGTGRMTDDGHIGRMAVLQAYRRQGIGRAILKALLAAAEKRGIEQVYLNAQVSAIGFYQALGFKRSGAPFMEAGIEHVCMVRHIAI